MFSQTSPRFIPSFTRGFFAAFSVEPIKSTKAYGSRLVSTNSFWLRLQQKAACFLLFAFSFDVAVKSAGSYVIPVLSLMGETN